MSDTLPLFEETTAPFRQELKESLTRLAGKRIYFGTSSWKYEGWLGQIYSYERYLSRGRFSKRHFEQHCLREYAETFPMVCGDFSFYQFPTPAFWKQLFDSAPQQLQFSFKIPEEITVPRFPSHPRYGARAGRKNDSFLDLRLLDESFLRLLAPYQARVPLLIFEFGAACGEIFEPMEFAERLHRFLRALPKTFRYAVEVRDAAFLEEPSHLRVLKEEGVAHVFNAWTKMPALANQLQQESAFTADFTVVRALLKAGRSYEQAVASFSPYRSIQEPDPGSRQAIRDIIVRCVRRGEPAYIYVNNRLEGNAPMTIHEILADLDL